MGLIASACVGTACSDIPAAPQDRTPVISLTLVAGESLHVATIVEASAADSAIPRDPAGIGPSRVALHILDEQGGVHPLVPDGPAGRHTVVLRVTAGETYELEGTIDDQAVAARTVAPRSFAIAVPSGDTITADDGVVSVAVFRVPYRFESDASAFGYVVSPSGEGAVGGGAGLSTAEGELSFFRDGAGARTIVFLAYSVDAAEWFVRTTPRSNITGAFGGFGAALALRRVLVMP